MYSGKLGVQNENFILIKVPIMENQLIIKKLFFINL